MTYANVLTLAIALAAAASDLARGKVYNWLTYPAAVLGVVLSLILRTPSPVESAAGLATALVLYSLFYRFCGLGAGDVKLMAAIGAFQGPAFIVFSSVYILAFGVVAGLFVLASKGRLFRSLQWVLRTVSARPRETDLTRMPFAPAIFLGVAYCVYLEAVRGPFAFGFWI